MNAPATHDDVATRSTSERRAERLDITDARADRGRVSETFAIIQAFAMVCALAFVIVMIWRRMVERRFVFVSLDVGWLAPLSHAFFFGLVALPLLVATPRLSRSQAIRLAVGLGAFTVVLSLLLPWTQIGRIPMIVASLGVGVAMGREVVRDVTWWPRAARRVAVGIAVPMLVLGGAYTVWRGIRTQRVVDGLPPIAAADQPNVLFLVLDTVRGDELSTYGYPRATTPNIDRLATRGVLFERATATSSWTLASHGSMFTGHFSGRLDLGFKYPYRGDETTLAEAFRARGYECTGFVANLNYTAWDSGLDRGFARWFDYRVSPTQVVKSSYLGMSAIVDSLLRSRTPRDAWRTLRDHELFVDPNPYSDSRDASELVDRLLEWQANRGSAATRPYFAFVNFFDAHTPLQPPERLRSRFASKPKARDLYDASLFFIDEQIGRLLATLEQRGALRNTLVVLTADHGEHFGDHGRFGHGNSLYMPLLHVPLVLAFPGHLPAGVRVSSSMSLRDIAATVADVTGLAASTRFPGHSLAPLWATRDSTIASPPTSPELAELYSTRTDSVMFTAGVVPRAQRSSLIQGEWHYIVRSKLRAEELYRLSADPGERTNLVDDSAFRSSLDSMRSRLTEVLRQDGAPPALTLAPGAAPAVVPAASK